MSKTFWEVREEIIGNFLSIIGLVSPKVSILHKFHCETTSYAIQNILGVKIEKHQLAMLYVASYMPAHVTKRCM